MLVGITNNAFAAVTVEDDLGRIITIENPAKRIISLYSSFDEIFSDMHMTENIIAKTSAETSIVEIQHLPTIGTHMRPNLELIVGMAPDLVLQMGGREEAVQVVNDLERLGITTAYFKVASFDDLFRVIQKIGVLTNHEGDAADLERKMKERLKAVAMAVSMINDRPSVFFEVRSPKLLTVGNQSMVSEIIRKAGGSNCIKSDGKLVRINEEELFRISPEVYILQRGPMNSAPVPLPERPRLSRLQAVINGRWHVVDEMIFSRPGPRNVNAVEQLFGILHGNERNPDNIVQ